MVELRFIEIVPETRSGTIMRRLLRDIVARREKVSDTTTGAAVQAGPRLLPPARRHMG